MTAPVASAPLHSEEAERSVLGGLMFRPELIGKLPIEVNDFFAMRHQTIWSAMINLDESGAPVDRTTIVGEIRRSERLGMFGGDEGKALAYLMDLELSCPSPENVERYVKDELHWYARKRAVVSVLSELHQRAIRSDRESGEDVLLEAITKLQRLDTRVIDPTVCLSDLMLAEVADLERDMAAAERGEWTGGMPTGIRKLDENTGGMPLGSVTLFLGETGSGKSTLAMQLCRAAWAEAGDIPLLFSYEDGKRSFARRALGQESGIPTFKIGARKLTTNELRQVIVQGMRNAGQRRERIAKFRGETVDNLCQTVRRLRSVGPPPGAKSIGRLAVIDYFQVIPKPRERWINSTPEALAEISQRIEDLAATEDIAVALFAQVKDEVKERGGVITDVRDCADGRAAGKGCKLGIGIYRPAMYDQNADPKAGKLLIVKNNQGQSNVAVDVYLDLATHTIRDVNP